MERMLEQRKIKFISIIIVCFLSVSLHLKCLASEKFVLKIDSVKKSSDKYELSIDSPVLSDDIAESQVSVWLNEMVDYFIREAESAAASDFGPSTFEVNLAEQYNSGNFLSLKFDVAEYLGGAHPNVFNETFVFNMNSGRRRTIDDVFENPEKALLSVSCMAVKQIAEQKGRALTDMEIGALLPVEQNYSHFALTGNGIMFFFPVYQLGCRSDGQYKILILSSDIEKYLAPEIRGAFGNPSGSD